MKTFSQHVDLRSRLAMAAFLKDHFRYWTMHSWNRAASYANCVKVHKLDLAPQQLERAWRLLECDEVFVALNGILADWAAQHDWHWQAGFNGHSAGYLVLYQGRLEYEHARTAQCDQCGQTTWHMIDTPCTRASCGGTLRVLAKPIPRIVTFPGRGLDEGEDFDSWDMNSLRERVKLVRDFDRLCYELLKAFVTFCDQYEAVDEEILVPKTVRVLKAL